jgi:REP element-mobilizing transposase RayT
MWNLPPPPGFQGLDPRKPVTVYWRHLPHWRQDGATYFVTFRLADSLPHSKLRELRELKHQWEQKYPPPQSDEQIDELVLETMRRYELWLDQGIGSCRLQDRRAAKFVVDGMHHFDNVRYEIGCYVVMPNHAHAIVRPKGGPDASLEEILQSWKSYTARRINGLFGLEGQLWQDESFDRIIRDEEHLWRSIQYIGRNPEAAGLHEGQYCRWIRPSWVELGWRFVDDEST